MIIKKNFTLKNVIQFSGHHFVWLVPFMAIIAYLEFYTDLTWLRVPWQPIGVIGTAVAFYLGFKNNQSYDRLWEARKVWGANVNSSRAWGSSINAFVSNQFTLENQNDEALHAIKKKLIYRHIAWLYALRSQLLIPTPWEHISQKGLVAKFARRNRKRFGIDLLSDEVTVAELHKFLDKNEFEHLLAKKNTATQIIDKQSSALADLRANTLIDDFRHMELQKLLNEFYVHQGKLERIKKFPLPRQYGSMSYILVGLFIAIMPFGVMPLFTQLGAGGFYMAVFASVLVAWVYLIMELVGDYSENPFEGTGNDIPMHSLCRVIEIDLREMLGETNLPPDVKAVNDVLM